MYTCENCIKCCLLWNIFHESIYVAHMKSTITTTILTDVIEWLSCDLDYCGIIWKSKQEINKQTWTMKEWQYTKWGPCHVKEPTQCKTWRLFNPQGRFVQYIHWQDAPMRTVSNMPEVHTFWKCGWGLKLLIPHIRVVCHSSCGSGLNKTKKWMFQSAAGVGWRGYRGFAEFCWGTSHIQHNASYRLQQILTPTLIW